MLACQHQILRGSTFQVRPSEAPEPTGRGKMPLPLSSFVVARVAGSWHGNS
jgi:hypothetical protein